MNPRDRDIQQGNDPAAQTTQTGGQSVRDDIIIGGPETDRRASDVRDTAGARNTAGTRDTRDTGDATDATDQGFLPPERMDNLRERWDEVQAGFVDDPRTAVQNAQQLVSELVNELTETFSRERGTLEGQWSKGGEADTEALRVALQRYRSFFNRLLRT